VSTQPTTGLLLLLVRYPVSDITLNTVGKKGIERSKSRIEGAENMAAPQSHEHVLTEILLVTEAEIRNYFINLSSKNVVNILLVLRIENPEVFYALRVKL
jgi:hypothetical protein